MRLDFASFLSIWMLHFRLDEDIFWKTMNPARLHRLYDSYFGRTKKTELRKQEEKPKSLSAYLRGGG